MLAPSLSISISFQLLVTQSFSQNIKYDDIAYLGLVYQSYKNKLGSKIHDVGNNCNSASDLLLGAIQTIS